MEESAISHVMAGAAHEATHIEEKGHGGAGILARKRELFIAATVLILLLTVYFRVPLLKYAGFYEPDGFYHFSVIRAAVNHDFVVPKTLSISGWPAPTPVSEPVGLYWVTLFPYAILQFFGVNYYTVMRLVPLLFGILDVIGAYFIAGLITKDKRFGLLAMLFVALSGGDEARTSALIYRGDGFVTIFLLIAIVFMVKVFRSDSNRNKAIFAAVSGVALSVSNLVWNGAAFAVAVYALSFMVILSVAFVMSREKTIDDLKYILGSLFLWFMLTTLFIAAGFMGYQTFTGVQFFYIFVPAAIGWTIAYYLTNRSRIIGNSKTLRLGVLGAVAAIIGIVAVVFASSMINAIFINNGFITAGNSHVSKTSSTIFYSTVQELQPPTSGFLFASFATNLYLTLPTLLILLSTYVGHITLLFLVLLLSFAPYLFMQVYDSGEFSSGNARLRLELNETILAMVSYFAATAYLQMHAIRFNSLISIPIAILSAYTLYWLIVYSKFRANALRRHAAVLTVLLVTALALGTQLASVMTATSNSSAIGQIETYIIPLAIVGAVLLGANARSKHEKTVAGVALLAITLVYILVQYAALAASANIAVAAILLLVSMSAMVYVEHERNVNLWPWIVIILFLYTTIYFGTIYTANLVPADQINPQFLAAASWLRNNTPANSVILSLWPDGSVIEGMGNRTSVMDSVGAQNYTKSDAFAVWLLNTSSDPQFITSPGIGKPDYLFVRNSWLLESGGIFQEAAADETLNPQNYSNIKFQTFDEAANATTTKFSFTSPQITNGLSIGAALYITNTGTQKGMHAFLELINSSTYQGLQSLPLHSVIFYNQSSLTYNQVNMSNITAAQGYSIFLNYSGTPRPGTSVNITGAYVISPGLARSNLFKLLYLCGANGCEWNNSVVTLKMVYGNSDSKIYRIVYNKSTNVTGT